MTSLVHRVSFSTNRRFLIFLRNLFDTSRIFLCSPFSTNQLLNYSRNFFRSSFASNRRLLNSSFFLLFPPDLIYFLRFYICSKWHFSSSTRLFFALESFLVFENLFYLSFSHRIQLFLFFLAFCGFYLCPRSFFTNHHFLNFSKAFLSLFFFLPIDIFNFFYDFSFVFYLPILSQIILESIFALFFAFNRRLLNSSSFLLLSIVVFQILYFFKCHFLSSTRSSLIVPESFFLLF